MRAPVALTLCAVVGIWVTVRDQDVQMVMVPQANAREVAFLKDVQIGHDRPEPKVSLVFVQLPFQVPFDFSFERTFINLRFTMLPKDEFPGKRELSNDLRYLRFMQTQAHFGLGNRVYDGRCSTVIDELVFNYKCRGQLNGTPTNITERSPEMSFNMGSTLNENVWPLKVSQRGFGNSGGYFGSVGDSARCLIRASQKTNLNDRYSGQYQAENRESQSVERYGFAYRPLPKGYFWKFWGWAALFGIGGGILICWLLGAFR